MIAIVDYGVGNVGSIRNMLERAGATNVIASSDSNVLSKADKLVLPGVGSWDRAMSRLEEYKLIDSLNELVIREGKPILGVCLGMQLLAEASEEGERPGLGWLRGKVIRFRFPEGVRRTVPHMGWSWVTTVRPDPMFPATDEAPRYYFVHSYHLTCEDPHDAVAISDYGIPFTCAVRKKNIIGVQFHPEKSHRFGLALMKRFVEDPA